MVGADAVLLGHSEGTPTPDVTLPAEALVRLVYGRLDAAHTPPVEGDRAALEALREVFKGI